MQQPKPQRSHVWVRGKSTGINFRTEESWRQHITAVGMEKIQMRGRGVTNVHPAQTHVQWGELPPAPTGKASEKVRPKQKGMLGICLSVHIYSKLTVTYPYKELENAKCQAGEGRHGIPYLAMVVFGGINFPTMNRRTVL